MSTTPTDPPCLFSPLQGAKPGVKAGAKKRTGGKKVAPAPLAVSKKVEVKKVTNPLFEKRPKNFGIGQYKCKKQKPNPLNLTSLFLQYNFQARMFSPSAT